MAASSDERQKRKQCKECPPDSRRPALYPGPRCASHHREKKKADKKASHSRRVKSVYSITGEEYAAIKEAQGGKCYICQRATGAAKNLAVDHDHACCPGKTSCGYCVRMLGCSGCNSMLAHVRDDIEALQRAIEVIRTRPAQTTLRRLRNESESR